MAKKFKDTLVINLFGGPGTGKSVMAAELFSKLKRKGVETEMALEYAKDKVWENSLGVFENQLYVFAKQYHRIHRLLGKVQVIITDSPIILTGYYDLGKNPEFYEFVKNTHFKLENNINIFINRKPENYSENGRYQNLEQSIKIDNDLLELLNSHNIEFINVQDSEEESNKIINYIIDSINKRA